MKNFPPLTSAETRPLLPLGVQVLLPSHQFTCAGRVTRWGVLAEGGRGEHGMHFQIWRPVLPLERVGGKDDPLPSSFTLVGSTYSPIELEPGVRLMYVQPDEPSKIRFEKGDVIGFYIEDNPLIEDDFQVPVHREDGIESVVLYANASEPQRALEMGELTSELPGAPVIRVEIEPGKREYCNLQVGCQRQHSLCTQAQIHHEWSTI